MTKTEYVEIIKNLSAALYDELNEFVKKSKYDRTFTGKITARVNDQRCKVLYSGKTYTTSIYTTYKIGDIVKVCIPCNNEIESFVVVNCGQSSLTSIPETERR